MKTTSHLAIPILLFYSLLIAGCPGPFRKMPASAPPPPWTDSVKGLIANGDYGDAIARMEEWLKKSPKNEDMALAWYLQGYMEAYGRSDYKKARPPLQKLIDTDPKHPLVPLAIRLLADCYYFDKRYEEARRQYGTLLSLYGDQGYGAYALLMTGDCFLLENKPGEALTAWRDAVDKYAQYPHALKAQLQVANLYIGLQDPQTARPELQKVLSMTNDKAILALVSDELLKLDAGQRQRTRRKAAAALE